MLDPVGVCCLEFSSRSCYSSAIICRDAYVYAERHQAFSHVMSLSKVYFGIIINDVHLNIWKAKSEDDNDS